MMMERTRPKDLVRNMATWDIRVVAVLRKIRVLQLMVLTNNSINEDVLHTRLKNVIMGHGEE